MYKKKVDKLVGECIENVAEVKLSKINSTKDEIKHKCNFSHCTLLYFQYFFQLTLELVTVLLIFVCT